MVLIILISGILLTKPYSLSWGYGPPESLILVLLVLLILVVAQGKPLLKAAPPAPASREGVPELRFAVRDPPADPGRSIFQP